MEDEYESLPNNSPWHHHMMAGSCAGILEHAFMYPVDSIKTRMMCLNPPAKAQYSGLIDGFKKMNVSEGLLKSMRGVMAVVVGAGPAHALYFSVYEKVKDTFSSDKLPWLNSASYGLAGASATVVHDAVMTPTDAVKQRMQVFNSPYKNSLDCLRTLVSNEGISVLYRAYFTQLSMTVPHHMTHVIIYELCQDWLNKDRQYRPLVHVSAGALGGAVAAFITTPLDVCKTVINTQTSKSLKELPVNYKPINGLVSSARAIYFVGGLKSFFRGAVARVVFTMPGTAISWSVYEFFKHTLANNNPLIPSFIPQETFLRDTLTSKIAD